MHPYRPSGEHWNAERQRQCEKMYVSFAVLLLLQSGSLFRFYQFALFFSSPSRSCSTTSLSPSGCSQQPAAATAYTETCVVSLKCVVRAAGGGEGIKSSHRPGKSEQKDLREDSEWARERAERREGGGWDSFVSPWHPPFRIPRRLSPLLFPTSV